MRIIERITENRTSHLKRAIPYQNDVIRSISDIGGVDAFRLYTEINLRKGFQPELYITPNILIRRLGRSEQYWRKQVKGQLKLLVEKNILEVEIDGDDSNNIDKAGLNDELKITVIINPGSPATYIKCVNTEIFNIQESISSNTLFAVFVYLTMAVDNDVGFARVSLETLEKGLGVSDRTVEKAINVLEAEGFLKVKRGSYNPLLEKKQCNEYKVYDYNSLMHRAKHGLVSFAEKQSISESEEAESIVREKISEVMNAPVKFCPCVFMGAAANLFRDYYANVCERDILNIYDIADMKDLFEYYDGIMFVPGGAMVLDIHETTEGIDEYLSLFLESNCNFENSDEDILPVILLINNDLIKKAEEKLNKKADIEQLFQNNKLKSQIKYVFS